MEPVKPDDEYVLDHTHDAVCPRCGEEFDIPIYTKKDDAAQKETT